MRPAALRTSGGGVDPVCVKTFDTDPPIRLGDIQPQRPGVQQGRRLNRVLPEVYWCELCWKLCAFEEV